MAVQKQFVSIPMAEPLNTKADPKGGPFAGFSLIENMIRTRVGEVRKRFGYEQLSLTSTNYAPGTVNVGALVQASNYQAIDFLGTPGLISKPSGSNDYYVWRRYEQNSAWNAYPESRIPKITTTAFADLSQNSAFNVYSTDCAISGNIVCVVYDRGETVLGKVYAAFYDANSGEVLRSDLLLSDGVNDARKPRVAVNGTNFQVIWLDNATLQIKSRLISIATGVAAAEFTLAVDPYGAVGQQYFSMLACFGQVAFVYNSGATGVIKVLVLNTSGTVASSTTVAGELVTGVDDMISAVTDGTDLFIGYIQTSTNQIKAVRLSSALATVSGPTMLVTGIGSSPYQNLTAYVSGTTFRCYYSFNTSNNEQQTKQVSSTLSFGSPTVAITSYTSILASQAIPLSGEPVYLIAGNNDPAVSRDFGSAFLTAELWAKIMNDQVGIDLFGYGVLPSVVTFGTKVIVPIRRVLDIDAVNDAVCGVGLSIIETNPDFVQTIRVGDTTLIGGGTLKSFDGYQTTEVGWMTVPSQMRASVAGAGAMAVGTYQYTSVLEWVDGKGNVYRSAPSLPISVTLGVASQVSVRYQQFGLTTRNASNGFRNAHGKIVIYRTGANGTIFYRLTDAELLSNDSALGSTAFTDNTADSGLGLEFVYTTGDVLEDESPPSAKVLSTFKNRVFLVPSEDPNAIWYSKELAPQEGVSFSSVLQFRVDPIGGDIMALAEMDEKIVILKKGAVLVTVGDGANQLGQGGYNQPQLVSAEIGCIEPRSVIRTSDGVMFQSAKGIWLLDRSLNLQYVGMGVETYNNRTITSAVNLQSLNQTRFTTSNGEILVWENVFDQWYVWTGLAAKSSLLWNGEYTILKTDGNVWREKTTLFTDNGSAVISRLITFPIAVAQIQGYQRTFRLIMFGEYRGPHKAICKLAFDQKEYFEEQFEITPTSSVTWTDTTYQNTTTNLGSTTDNVWQFEVRPATQRCQSVRILLEDNFTALTPGNSFTLSGFGAEVGTLGGRFRVPPSTKVMT